MRALGSLPLFQISYVALVAAVLVITAIGFLNAGEFVAIFEYPIPVPGRMRWLLVASLTLAIGSTIYRFACPDRVREFSETQWVEQLGRARLIYLAQAMRRRELQVPAAAFLGVGGAAGLALLLERVWVAVRYLLAAM